ncbi:helix-turn-helix domain-containing protein [Paenibacillus sp. IB182496]|uniref:Helix-turn-helix domain-containing protein n=1 Tax=Paenibacillus sabuli TaxID=2772509 RepID=A0A927GQX0_9BACL|nr:sugar diacid recognition domain-containing protein [Paenibacillus sabuli]MBD2844818.1 helix-turn-helix domain-containing protein [Paenibacillus sabuli]
MLTPELAREIVRETMERVQWNINMMDVSGTIIASGTPERIGECHPGAALAVRSGEAVRIDLPAAQWGKSQAGINLPVACGGRIVGAVGITGAPETIEPVSALVRMTAELMLRQAQLARQLESRRRGLDRLLAELLREAPDRVVAAEQAAALGVRVPLPSRVVELALSGEARATDELRTRLERLPELADALCGEPAPQRLTLLLPAALEEGGGNAYADLEAEGAETAVVATVRRRLTELLRRAGADARCRAGVSAPVRDLAQLPIGSDEARAALAVSAHAEAHTSGASSLALARGAKPPGDQESDRAAQARTGEPGVVFYREVEGPAMLRLIPAAHRSRLAARFADPAAWSEELRLTLAAYFAADLNAAQASRALGVHRNTVLYRLEQCRRQLGYNPERFGDAWLLQALLWLGEDETTNPGR